MSSGNSGSGVRCSGDGGWCPALASVQSSQQSEPECEGREVPCSQPRVPAAHSSPHSGRCLSEPPPSLDLSGLPPPQHPEPEPELEPGSTGHSAHSAGHRSEVLLSARIDNTII